MSSNALAFELTADTAGFDSAIKKSQGALLGFGSKVSADLKNLVAGVASYEALKAFTHHTIEAMTSLKDFSEQTSLSTDDVQILQAAANKVGLSFENLQSGLTKFGVARRDAATSNQELLKTFNQYGIKLRELADPQVRNIDLLKKLAAAVDGVSLSDADRTRLAEMFGIKQGEKLLAVLNEIQHLGPIKLISKQDIDAVDKLTKDLEELKRNLVAIFGPVLGGAAKGVSAAAGGKGNTPTEEIFGKLFAGEAPGIDDFLRLAGELAGGAGLNLLISNARHLGNIKEKFSFDGNALPFPAGKKRNQGGAEVSGEIPLNEQWRRYYDFLDKEAELAERVRKINFDMLTPKEKQLDLQVRINEELERADELKKQGDVDSLRAAQSHLLTAEQLNEQLLGLNAALKPNIPRADQAAAAGGFIGGAVNFNPANFQNRELINLTQQVRDNTARIAEKIATPTNPEGVF